MGFRPVPWATPSTELTPQPQGGRAGDHRGRVALCAAGILHTLTRWRSTKLVGLGPPAGVSNGWVGSPMTSMTISGPHSRWRGAAAPTAASPASPCSAIAYRRSHGRSLHARERGAGLRLVQCQQVQRRGHRLATSQTPRRTHVPAALRGDLIGAPSAIHRRRGFDRRHRRRLVRDTAHDAESSRVSSFNSQ